ncbi:MAG TPA: T9SS type A sorting domain-containing protein [Ignavibacteriaceae bacterium]|nr:T9SS type A sorting domain-containing protein [Ignavibacteriaceae bacterium]
MKKIVLVIGLITFYSFQLNAQWIQSNGPYYNNQLISPSAITFNGSNIFTGTIQAGSIFKSSDNGTNWTLTNTGITSSYINTLVCSNGVLLAGTDYGIFRSTNNGYEWYPSNSGLTSLFITTLTSNKNYIFAGTPNGIYLSIDTGIHWNPINTDMSEIQITGILNMGDTLYAATLSEGIYISTDLGKSWSMSNNGFTSPATMGLTEVDGNIFAVSRNRGVFKSTDKGMHWSASDNGLPSQLYPRTIISYDSLLFLGAGIGVFMSDDQAINWKNITPGLANTVAEVLGANSDTLYVGSYQGGIWKRSITNILTEVKKDFSEVPNKFSLLQNYPNPFNPSTKISWLSPISGWQTLKVYDILGNEVATLVNEYRSAGTYEIEFNPESSFKNPASGIYFYRLQAGNFVDTKKMIYLK